MKRQTLMMMTFFALLAVAGVAFGEGKQPPPTEPQIFAQGQIQQQQMQQDQLQAQQQKQTNDQDQANNQETNVNTPRQRSKVKILNVPSVSAPGMHSSNPCVVGSSGGVAAAGFGISGGKQKIDDECVKRELTRIAFAAGLMNRGTYMLCQQSVTAGMYESLDHCLGFDVITAEEFEKLLLKERQRADEQTEKAERIEDAIEGLTK